MVSSDFVPLQIFGAPEDALEWVNVLKQEKIPYEWEEDAPGLDITFAFSQATRKFLLKVPQAYLGQARRVLQDMAREWVSRYDHTHYLYHFSLEELYEIIERRDEWSMEDVLMAKRILAERGRYISEEEEAELYHNRLLEIRQAKRANLGWITGLYLFAFVGGYFSLVLAWLYVSSKKTDPEGNRYYSYDRWTRKHARNIMVLSVFGIGLWFLVLYLIHLGI
jgi:hypothetical protein